MAMIRYSRYLLSISLGLFTPLLIMGIIIAFVQKELMHLLYVLPATVILIIIFGFGGAYIWSKLHRRAISKWGDRYWVCMLSAVGSALLCLLPITLIIALSSGDRAGVLTFFQGVLFFSIYAIPVSLISSVILYKFYRSR